MMPMQLASVSQLKHFHNLLIIIIVSIRQFCRQPNSRKRRMKSAVRHSRAIPRQNLTQKQARLAQMLVRSIMAILVIYQQKQAIMRMALMMRCQKQKKNHRANAPKKWLKIALIHLASLMQKPQRLSHRRTISPVFRVPPRLIRANIPKSV